MSRTAPPSLASSTAYRTTQPAAMVSVGTAIYSEEKVEPRACQFKVMVGPKLREPKPKLFSSQNRTEVYYSGLY